MTRSGRKTALLFALAALCAFLLPASSDAGVSKRKIRSHISKYPSSRGKIGIMVRSAETGRTVFRHNSKKEFIPASNNKILSSVAALSLLGKDFRFRTEFYLGGGIFSGVGHGGLYVKGFGDPTIDLSQLRLIAGKIKSLGITRIDGGVYLDGSYFDDARYGEGWDPDWVNNRKGFCPPVTAFSYNYNTAKIRILPSRTRGARASLMPTSMIPFPITNKVVTSKKRDGVSVKFNGHSALTLRGYTPYKKRGASVEFSVPDPSLYFGKALIQVLRDSGIKVDRRVRRDKVPRWAGKIYTHYSEPLSKVIREYNKESVNLIGESLVKVMGAEIVGGPGSWESGTRVIENRMREIGLNGNFSVADGSGLSRLNRVSPEDMTRALVEAYNDRNYSQEFIDSLPVAAVDGTLKKRFRELKGRVYAKTGYLQGARSLSGYAFAKDGKVYAFSIISNGMGTRVKKLQTLVLKELVN